MASAGFPAAFATNLLRMVVYVPDTKPGVVKPVSELPNGDRPALILTVTGLLNRELQDRAARLNAANAAGLAAKLASGVILMNSCAGAELAASRQAPQVT